MYFKKTERKSRLLLCMKLIFPIFTIIIIQHFKFDHKSFYRYFLLPVLNNVTDIICNKVHYSVLNYQIL